MHLTQGGRGHRLFIELGEELAEGTLELLLDPLADPGERQEGRLGLEHLEDLGGLRREQFGVPQRDHLTDLHHRTLEVAHGVGHSRRVAKMGPQQIFATSLLILEHAAQALAQVAAGHRATQPAHAKEALYPSGGDVAAVVVWRGALGHRATA